MNNGGGDGDDDVDDDKDRCLGLQDPSSDGDGSPSASSPSRSLMEVRFRGVPVSLCLRSVIRLHGVEVFDEADPPIGGTGASYGWGPTYHWSLNLLSTLFRKFLL